jgi:Na+/H+-dicarboxylate symporter
VLSPQYLIWLLPLVALVRGRRGAAAGALLVVSMLLTQLWFPYRYLDLVYGFDPTASWLVLARDLALVVLLATLVWPQGRFRARHPDITRSGHALAS